MTRAPKNRSLDPLQGIATSPKSEEITTGDNPVADDITIRSAMLDSKVLSSLLEMESDSAYEIARLFEPWSTDELLELMQDQDEEIRRFGCMGVSNRIEPRALGALIAALGDPSQDVRVEAIFGLGELQDKNAVQPLCGLLKQHADYFEQLNVLVALERIGDSSAIPAIRANEESMGKKNTWERQRRLRALLSLGDKDALPKVIQSAEQGDVDLSQRRIAREACRESIEILGRFKIKEAVPIIVKALQNGWHPLRKEAAIALGEIGDRSAAMPLVNLLKGENQESVSACARDAIVKIGDVSVVDELVDMIRSDFKYSPSIRSYGKPAENAARTLLRFGLGSEVDGLLEGFLKRTHIHRVSQKLDESISALKVSDSRFLSIQS